MISHLSRLGFGLSSIAGSGNYAHQERLIKTAIENGITHFDVAPYYGSGDAEIILGKVLKGCNDNVTITTKFGLVPFSGGSSFIRSVARPAFKHFGGLKKLVVKAISQTHHPKQERFMAGSIKQSIAISTAKIGRPIDFFLLHDASKDFATNNELMAEMESIKECGLTRFIGISGTTSSVQDIINLHPKMYSTIQFENSLTSRAPNDLLQNSDTKAITHRAIQGSLSQLLFLIKNRPGFKSIWEKQTGINPDDTVLLSQILLEIALLENKNGSVLFSTTKPHRIKDISKSVSCPIITDLSIKDTIYSLFNDIYIAT